MDLPGLHSKRVALLGQQAPVALVLSGAPARFVTTPLKLPDAPSTGDRLTFQGVRDCRAHIPTTLVKRRTENAALPGGRPERSQRFSRGREVVGLRQSSLRESWGPGNVDGLGDRERSVSSPPSDHWETMLTTITPDPQLPSAHSSFTSAAASASFSTSNTTSQAGTQSTRSASDGSTPTDLTEPMIQGGWEEQLFCESDEDYDGQVVERFPGFDDLDDDQGSRRRTEQRDRNVWTAAPSPPARNPGRYSSDAHSRLREITNIIQNYNTDRAPSASRSQSPRSRNHVPDVVDGFIDAPANDDRRDSAAVVPNVSRPGSAQNERNERSREATAEQESFDMYIVDPDDPDQRPNRVPTHSLHAPDDQPRGRDYLRAIADHLGLEHGRLAQEDRSADDILDEILDGA
ncbi:hypothetical protein BC567DRAFT_211255 [Phyllosticta citribraziliensis]